MAPATVRAVTVTAIAIPNYHTRYCLFSGYASVMVALRYIRTSASWIK